MLSLRAGLLVSFLLILTMSQPGAIAPGNAVMADHPRVVIAAPGATTGEVTLTLRSVSRVSTRLISVLTNAAATVELHGPPAPGTPPRAPGSPPPAPGTPPAAGGSSGPVIAAVEVPAGKQITLGPDGFRIVLKGIKPPLKAGDEVVLALVFDTVPGIIVRATVTIGPSR